ncbi:hypothetical protein COW36_24765 [bacterium (Candidatus Blackallbacteria) CG17_big_fil_post_rev_8_21_14_2_50_48_46]|uniref:Response regulatory domain-containing protein n=1 Tax=bacterium (Candidatus Blackallbacteria) CG17_big_fil_post_rev_8_21_14_2_50_48_46 TaxID=2014261 RepID=A0A2M7FXC3_9BACT|nr:MAG: hypothetical protein COW64_19705 [bacterium (Candidatus Blackallbacteria) CG18_big_fil_WC_8_21_14_2_50_49_26]PIW13881.1 MAG: hypothetical protein COW36_24765 [bacterium (Candidatus Blackallbacteria) CG17_big_fil_post_rev_8_21_14_2_50_48_46]PIW45107.1 MAG: hypothetical protein COW20_22395 [bacterium (Candidatus Blackallbacteria) CG13_big_fil_rev_8_21_14_2_50_49_14]
MAEFTLFKKYVLLRSVLRKEIQAIKILIVDDSMVARKIVIKHLQNHADYQNAEIIEAVSGEQGLEKFDRSIELVLSDWNMPGISGHDYN